jgi:hypothetical protein
MLANVDYKYFSVDGVPPVLNAGTEGSHFTRVFGTVGAIPNNNAYVSGIAPGLTFMIQEIQEGGLMADAIDDAIKRGAKVISISKSSSTLTEAQVRAYIDEYGVTFVLSGGNVDLTKPYSNAEQYGDLKHIPGVIIVGASDSLNQFPPGLDHKYGDGFDLLAPGHAVLGLTAYEPGYHAMKVLDGSSAAVPMVAGTVGLMLSLNPNLDPVQIECIIKSTTTDIDNDDPGEVWFEKLGTGILNVYNALEKTFDLSLGGVWTSKTITEPPITANSSFDHLIISNGAVIEFKNCEILMGSNGNIWVEEGSKLILDNVHVKYDQLQTCGANWKGITVVGPSVNSSMFPYPFSLHGKVEISNGSVIEGAQEGIATGTGLSWFHKGGIFQVSGSTFKNCRFGIKYNGYIDPTVPGQNPSYVINSDFICDSPIPGYRGQGVNTHIWLYNIRGLALSSNNFSNTVSNANLARRGVGRGRGIGGYNAGFQVGRVRDIIDNCLPVGSRSTFEGLEYGVVNFYGLPSKTLGYQASIYDADFINNHTDIYSSEDNLSVFWNNTHTWNSAYEGKDFVSGFDIYTAGIRAIKSLGPKRMKSSFNFNSEFQLGEYKFVANDHIDEGQALTVNGTNLSYKGYNYKNNFTSSNSLIYSVGEWFKHDPASTTKYNRIIPACNNYGENLKYGWMADPNANTPNFEFRLEVSSISGGQSEWYYTNNNFNTCLKAGNPSSANLSINGNGGNNFIGPNCKKIYAQSSLTPGTSCLQDVCGFFDYDPAFNFYQSNDLCATGLDMSSTRVYCPGADGTPGSEDDFEGWSYNETENGPPPTGIPGVEEEESITNGSLLLNFLNEFGIANSDLEEKNDETKKLLLTVTKQNPSLIYRSYAMALLGQFYALNVSIASQSTLDKVSFTDEHSIVQPGQSNSGQILLFPNPVSDIVRLDLSNAGLKTNNGEIYLINSVGQIVYRSQKSNVESTVDLDLSNLESGIYVLIFENNNQKVLRKLIKK